MKKSKKYLKYGLAILMCFVFVIMLFKIANDAFSVSWQKGDNKKSVITLNDGWLLNGEKPISLPANILESQIKNATFTLTKVMSGNVGRGSSLYTEIAYKNLDIYIDDNLVFSSSKDLKIIQGEVTRRALVGVKLAENIDGKTLKFVVNNSNVFENVRMSNVYLSSDNQYILNMIADESLILFVGILLLIFFLGTLLIVLLNKLFKNDIFSNIWFSFFCLGSGILILSNSLTVRLFVKNLSLLDDLYFFALFLLPYLFVKFMSGNYELFRTKTIKIIENSSLILFLLCVFEKVFLGNDIAFLIYGFYLIFGVITIYISIQSVKFYSKTDFTTKMFMIGCEIMVIATFLDVLTDFFISKYTCNLFFFRMGMVAFVALLITGIVHSIYELQGEKSKRQQIENLVNYDVLTGLNNRYCFENTVERLNNENVKQLTIIQFDLNELKSVNDNLGHNFGDIYIKQSADAIKEAFGSFGDIFRVGGDEFIALLYNICPDSLDNCIFSFKEIVKNYNCNNDKFVISIAKGISYFDKKIDKDIYRALRRADHEMYRYKRNQKTMLLSKKQDKAKLSTKEFSRTISAFKNHED